MKQKNGQKDKKGLAAFFRDSAIRWFDAVILLALMLFCFLSYEMRDLYHTAGCSYGYLDGHFLDFYDYLAANGIAEDGSTGLFASYLPTVYLIFAVWNIPMKLFGRMPQASAMLSLVPMLYAKILPCIAYFTCGTLVYKISVIFGMRERKAKLCTYAFLSMPVGLYGQFILGQYESFLILFILLGFYFWLKKKDLYFLLFFAVAVSIKYTALLVFLPLLVLREKKILKMLLYMVLVFAVAGIEFLVYMHSPVFMAYAFGIGGSGDAPTGYVTNAAYFTGFFLGGELKYVVYLAFVAVAFVLAFAYFKQTRDDNEEARYALYFVGLALAAFFCFSKWHPQWLMLLVPFFTIGAFLHKNTRAFFALELLFSVIFIMFCTCQFGLITDEVMIERGILKYLLPGRKLSSYSAMSDYFGFLDMSLELTILTALIAIFAVFRHPKMLAEDGSISQDGAIGWLRARYIIPILMFILVSLFVVKNTIDRPGPFYREEARAIFVNLTEEEEVTQKVVTENGSVSRLQFPVSRGEAFDPVYFTVRVEDEGGTVLYEKRLYSGDYAEGEVVRLKPRIKTQENAELSVIFTAEKPGQDAGFCLLGAEGDAYDEATSGGKTLGYHLDMVLFP